MFLLNQTRKRGNDGASLRSMVIISALLHALLLFVGLYSPSLPSQPRTFVPAYSVDLVTMPAETGERTAVARPSLEEEIRIGDRETEMAVRRPAEEARPVPVERIQVQRRDVTEDLDQALRQIQERVASAPRPEPAPRPGPPGPSHPQASPDAVADRMNVYYTSLWMRIREQWALPEAVLSDRNLEAVLAVTILRDGSMGRLTFEKRSGNRVFDESAEGAVRKAEPFPALPGWLNEQYIEVGIRFRSSDYQ